jgi:hypothetical protein
MVSEMSHNLIWTQNWSNCFTLKCRCGEWNESQSHLDTKLIKLVLLVLCPIEIVTHFTHHIYTLVWNSFISFVSKWDCDSFHSPYLHFSVKQFYQFCFQMRLWLMSLTISTFHIQLCYEIGVHILFFLSVWWPKHQTDKTVLH